MVGDVLALEPVPAGHALFHDAADVRHGNRRAVNLRLGDERDRGFVESERRVASRLRRFVAPRAPQRAPYFPLPRARLFVREHVGQRTHGHDVRRASQRGKTRVAYFGPGGRRAFERGSAAGVRAIFKRADASRGAVAAPRPRVRLLQRLQTHAQSVVGGVRDLGVGVQVVQRVVLRDLGRERLRLRRGGGGAEPGGPTRRVFAPGIRGRDRVGARAGGRRLARGERDRPSAAKAGRARDRAAVERRGPGGARVKGAGERGVSVSAQGETRRNRAWGDVGRHVAADSRARGRFPRGCEKHREKRASGPHAASHERTRRAVLSWQARRASDSRGRSNERARKHGKSYTVIDFFFFFGTFGRHKVTDLSVRRSRRTRIVSCRANMRRHVRRHTRRASTQHGKRASTLIRVYRYTTKFAAARRNARVTASSSLPPRTPPSARRRAYRRASPRRAGRTIARTARRVSR